MKKVILLVIVLFSIVEMSSLEVPLLTSREEVLTFFEEQGADYEEKPTDIADYAYIRYDSTLLEEEVTAIYLFDSKDRLSSFSYALYQFKDTTRLLRALNHKYGEPETLAKGRDGIYVYLDEETEILLMAENGGYTFLSYRHIYDSTIDSQNL